MQAFSADTKQNAPTNVSALFACRFNLLAEKKGFEPLIFKA